MKNKNLKNLFYSFVLFLLVFPVSIFAQQNNEEGIVKCIQNCGFNDFIHFINEVVDFIFKYVAMPFAAIMFCYAGVLLVTSGGNQESMKKAKSIFINVLIGFVLALVAWLIVHTIFQILGYKDADWIGF